MRFWLALIACLYFTIGPSWAVTFDAATIDGTTILVVEGRFSPNENMSKFASAVINSRPDVVTFNSPGGAIYPAMELGRLIRAFELPTLQVRTNECASACALAFLGGSVRAAEAGSIGVHQSSFSANPSIDTGAAVSAVQSVTADILEYLNEMGAGSGLLQLSLRYTSDDMRYLSQSEMVEHGVVTGSTPATVAQEPATGRLNSPATFEAPSTLAPQPSFPSPARLEVPQARSGWVRHPRGEIELKAGPHPDAANFGLVRNRTAVQILGNDGRWYAVSIGGSRGYLHDTWVLVDQFDSGAFDARHIQIKSYEFAEEAEAFARRSPLPLSVYLSTNGWFAVTLEATFDKDEGEQLLSLLKGRKEVPDDSYLSYGNTYARQICCD